MAPYIVSARAFNMALSTFLAFKGQIIKLRDHLTATGRDLKDNPELTEVSVSLHKLLKRLNSGTSAVASRWIDMALSDLLSFWKHQPSWTAFLAELSSFYSANRIRGYKMFSKKISDS
ncbi:hypothetical protein C8R47DRAFT_1071210 [Mycena vitilis]|nr:hypothetical protein C8R47DRAFT_1071210 [Mycena vitilis]